MISSESYNQITAVIIDAEEESSYETSLTTTSFDLTTSLVISDMIKNIFYNDSSSTSMDIVNNNFTNGSSSRGHCTVILSQRNYVLLPFITLIFCLSVIGNSLVIVTILQNRWMRTVTNFLLLNLAISDLIFTIICMPPTLTGYLFQCFFAGPFMCKISYYMQPVSVAACSFTLVVIALERYKAICQPLHSQHWKTKSHALTMIFAVWTLAFLCSIPLAVATVLTEHEPGKFNCTFEMEYEARAIFFGFLVTALFFIPLSLMILLYSLVITTLWKGMQLETQSAGRELVVVNSGCKSPSDDSSSVNGSAKSKPTAILRNIGHSVRDKSKLSLNAITRRKYSNVVIHAPVTSSTSTSSTVNIIKSETKKCRKDTMDDPSVLRSTHAERSLLAKKRVIKMLAAIVVEFFVCWMPLYSLILYISVKSNSSPMPPPYLHPSFLILAYISTCTNPITYCFLNVKFRHAMLITIGCKFMVKNSHQYNNTSVYLPSTAIVMPKKSTDERSNGAVDSLVKLHQSKYGSHQLLSASSRNSSTNRLPVNNTSDTFNSGPFNSEKRYLSPPKDRTQDSFMDDDRTTANNSMIDEESRAEKETTM